MACAGLVVCSQEVVLKFTKRQGAGACRTSGYHQRIGRRCACNRYIGCTATVQWDSFDWVFDYHRRRSLNPYKKMYVLSALPAACTLLRRTSVPNSDTLRFMCSQMAPPLCLRRSAASHRRRQAAGGPPICNVRVCRQANCLVSWTSAPPDSRARPAGPQFR